MFRRVMWCCMVAGAAYGSGCVTTPPRDVASRPLPPALTGLQRTEGPDHRTQRHRHPAAAAAEAELGEEVARELPAVPRQEVIPPDPGAERLLGSMLRGLSDPPAGPDGIFRIAIDLKNLSRSPAREFDRFVDRLGKLLSRAGREHRVTFNAGSEAEEADEPRVHYRLAGSAYLITADGFDFWEVYLSLTAEDGARTLWRAPGPVRVLRQPGPAHVQQVFPPGDSGAAPQ